MLFVSALPRASETMPMLLNVLLIVDDAVEAATVRAALMNPKNGVFHVEWVRTLAEGLQRMGREEARRARVTDGIAAILVDLFLPDSRGIDTFDRLLAAAPSIPILVLVTEIDQGTAELAVQHGAQDFLLKNRLDDYWLPKSLRSVVVRAANGDALFQEKERAEVTLNSIGDAVMSTDESCIVTFLNGVAETLTGWPLAEARGRPVHEVFRIIDAGSRMPVANPMRMAIRENRTVGLTPDCILVRRDGGEAAIEDSAAPIHDRRKHVTGAVMVFHDVSAARAQAQRMSHLAQHDGLTDLPNRMLLNDRLTQAMASVRRNQNKLALLFLDLDHFKHINDSLGHGVGDRLLQSTAKRLQSCIRSSDTVSRQGGDEFVILLPDVAHVDHPGICADKILRALKEPHHIDRHEIHITASIGVVTFPDDASDVEGLLQNADLAMYKAKTSGRNNYQFFQAKLNAAAVERLEVERGLRQALERNELVLHYQPQIDLATGGIAGVEALLRWRHPLRGLLHPPQFMTIAEETGLIVPMGRWVLREACRQARAWQVSGRRPLLMAVNVSAVELRDKEFAPGVRAILGETGLDPGCLELELTETFLMQDSNATASVLHAVDSMGIHLALDDFGTGYSSLSYVRRFPIDTLKIDRSFVGDLTTCVEDANIVSAVINLGASLGMLVVAEGVETRQQAAALREQACPRAQGFYFGHPLAARDFTPLLHAVLA